MVTFLEETNGLIKFQCFMDPMNLKKGAEMVTSGN
jgi:hypothetical protein